MADIKYFAADEAEATAGVLLQKIDSWCNNLETNGYLQKLRDSWSAYHGAYYADITSGHKIAFSGEQGEIANLPVNHVRNLAQHLLVMTTANRPSMEARASNTDFKSLSQAILANGLLDYYMREKRLEKYLKRAVEYAIVLGAGYVKMTWNATTGEIYEFNEETGTPIYEGDVEFANMSPFDVIVDSTKESPEGHDWVICRTWKNKHDLMAKYPDLARKIASIPTKDQNSRFKFGSFADDKTDDVAVFEMYHRRSEALPEGRYMMFLAQDVILHDGPLPYRMLPVFRISPADILGTPYGYTNIFDLLPLQDALNSLFSTILSNQSAFGVQNIIVPRGSDINPMQLAGGLNVIEYNQQAGKPESLNLTDTPAEIFKFTDMLSQQMEILSGVNSVSRGQPDPNLKSGAALALVQSMAIQFASGLQQSYVQLIEDVGSSLITMLRDFASVPRVAAIVGKSNRTFMKEFKGDDLANVNRVIVDVGNPLARTTAGRLEIAQQLLQMGLIKDPAQFLVVLNTGRLDVTYEGEQTELMLIRKENEKMISGESVTAIWIDEHKEHILEHKAVLADPDLRNDPEVVNLVLTHIQEHLDHLEQAKPESLIVLGQQPIAPPQQSAPPPPQEAAPSEAVAPPAGVIPPSAMVPGQEQPNMPNMPTPPAPFENLPVTAQEVPAQ
jgi:hypothetical protein